MALSKLPPISKVYEALSAVADNRVFLYETEAYVISSDHSKVYTVRFQDMVYSSNDRATSWQHYPGYPIIAVLISQDMFPAIIFVVIITVLLTPILLKVQMEKRLLVIFPYILFLV